MTDTEMLDVLQKLNDEANYTGRCVLRRSTTGRGWRLHETSDDEFGTPPKSVRQAIKLFVDRKAENKGDQNERVS